MNEGEYLELVNDLRDQYNDMKDSYEKKLSLLKQELEMEKNKFKFQYKLGQFDSPRPKASEGIYTSNYTLDRDILYS
tara:strand:+ start:2757 stop:2987 length:231 start_codon:yes stop_codon:yes gene_type:complete